MSRLTYASLQAVSLVESGFLDEFKIADHQQVEFISQIVVSLKFFMEIETEKQRSLVVPDHFQLLPSEIQLKEI